ISGAVSQCFCRAAVDFVARFPGQGNVQFHQRARFQLLSRDHITPPGLFLVENGDKINGRATTSTDPGLLPVASRDNDAAGGAIALLSENSENSLSREEEKAR